MGNSSLVSVTVFPVGSSFSPGADWPQNLID